MFRLRRYRAFALFAVFAILALYHFGNLRELNASSAAFLNSKDRSKPEDRPSEYEPQAASPPEKENSGAAKDREASAKDIEEVNGFDHSYEDSTDTAITSTSKTFSQTPTLSSKGYESVSTSSSTGLNDELNTFTTSTRSSDETQIATGTGVESESLGPKNTGAGKLDSGDGEEEDEDVAIRPTKPSPTSSLADTESESGTSDEQDDPPKPPHWSPLPEHFPVPSNRLISLPTGKPKAIPKIQYRFKDETATDKVDRQKKLDEIRTSFRVSWAGYRKNAWMQDELQPVSGGYRSKFGGWAATLVDSLDTLWIMDLKPEFEEAVKAVNDIDFTTSDRSDIPLFETTIRYLGGLVGAYDISEAKYKTLLNKAVELADVLMGSFDTPNRMPMTYYMWKPTIASQPHRAPTRAVLAEIGSLSVEFTRLAQITKEDKYYDAIARITNEFGEWQSKTNLPGLFPKNVDASGCRKPEVNYDSPNQIPLALEATQDKDNKIDHDIATSTGDSKEEPDSSSPVQLTESTEDRTLTETPKGKKKGDFPDSAKIQSTLKHDEDNEEDEISSKVHKVAMNDDEDGADGADEEATAVDTKPRKTKAEAEDDAIQAARSKASPLDKRQAADEESSVPPSAKPNADCEPQGLASPPYSVSEEFTLGGMADSVYEYFPKQYMLLGGLEDINQKMYESAADAAIKHLLYRPMIKDEKRNILFPGQLTVKDEQGTMNVKKSERDFFHEGSHLGCFVGGMFGVGAKIFNRNADLDIAKRLTDGCVWAYESTPTGIMPEGFEMIPCETQDICPFNQTRWYKALDPYGESRIANARAQQEQEEEARKLQQESETSEMYEDEDSIATQLSSATSEPTMATETATRVTGQYDESSSTNDTETGTSETQGPVAQRRRKRQLDDDDLDTPTKTSSSASDIDEFQDGDSVSTETSSDQSTVVSDEARNPAETSFVPAVPDIPEYTPPPIPTTQEVAEGRIESEHLPAGMVRVFAPKYILRPEAIESVFIMYRITGDNYWREKGWNMFLAIRQYTSAAFGASSISDVMSETPLHLDEMESFWLAETLKYFYLLFSDPSIVSLDDYIL